LEAAKTVADFKRVRLREDATVRRVLYTVTFGTPSPTAFHKPASHRSTDRLGETVENVMTSISTNGCRLQTFAVARGHDRSSCALYRYVPYDVAYSFA